VNSKIVGFVMAQVDFERNERFGRILTVGFTPAVSALDQRKNFMKLKFLLRDRDVKECRLQVREDNFPGVSIYRELGYEKTGSLEKDYGNTDGLYLEKSCDNRLIIKKFAFNRLICQFESRNTAKASKTQEKIAFAMPCIRFRK
jgi:ribosomal protein S18 acetylase RimI-like enzyme